MVVIAILFWLWFLASVVILVRRSIRRRRERRIRRDALRAALRDEAVAAAEGDLAETADAEVAEVIDAPLAVAAPSSVTTIARAAAAPVTVAQVIAGIEMPCGLVPLTLSDHDMRYDRGQRAHFVTTMVPALVVMTNLTEELERVGLTVTPIGDTAAIAKRGRLAVELRLYTIGALVDGVASTEFRSAPPNSVVVELDVVPV